MTITNPHRRTMTAVLAATIALAAPGAGHAGAVGGPEYGVPASGARVVSTAPVVADDFDWADAGIGGAAGGGLILLGLAGTKFVAHRHNHLASRRVGS